MRHRKTGLFPTFFNDNHRFHGRCAEGSKA